MPTEIDTTQHQQTRHNTNRQQHSTTPTDTTQHQQIRHNTNRYSTTPTDTTQHQQIRHNTNRHDPTPTDTTQHLQTRHNTNATHGRGLLVVVACLAETRRRSQDAEVGSRAPPPTLLSSFGEGAPPACCPGGRPHNTQKTEPRHQHFL